MLQKETMAQSRRRQVTQQQRLHNCVLCNNNTNNNNTYISIPPQGCNFRGGATSEEKQVYITIWSYGCSPQTNLYKRNTPDKHINAKSQRNNSQTNHAYVQFVVIVVDSHMAD